MKIAPGFGDRLRRLRLEREMTQTELAGTYSPGYVSQIEAGKKAPSPAAVRQFADRLRVSVKELALGVPPNFEAQVLARIQEGWRALYLGDYAEARRAFAWADRESRRFRFPVLQAKALVGRARCAERQGQTADAMKAFEAALDLYRDHAPAPAAVEAIAGISRCHQMSGSPRMALHVLEQYLLELEVADLREPSALMRLYASLVWPYCELGLRRQAIDAAVRALELQPRVDHPEQVAGMYVNVARALMNGGRAADAIDALNKAEEIFRDLNWKTEIGRAQVGRGIVLVAEGEPEKARDDMRSAFNHFPGSRIHPR